MPANAKEIVPREPRLALAETTVQLDVPDLGSGFEADCVNIGPGGLALRAPLLPEVGTLLCCTFESPIDGSRVEAECEVAWVAQSGPNLGEFGLRFVTLAADSVDALADLIRSGDRVLTRAETDALGWDAAPESAPHVVALQLEGVASELVAEVQADGNDVLVAEQELPFLRLGTAVTTDEGRRGTLTAVELRVVDDVPRLVITVAYEGALAEPDVSAPLDEEDTIPDDAPVPSAEPSLASPVVARGVPSVAPSERSAPRESPLRKLGEPVLDRASSVASAVRDVALPAVGRGLDAVREGASRSVEKLPEVGRAAQGGLARVQRFVGLFLEKARRPDEAPEAPRRRVQGQRTSVAAQPAAPERRIRGRHVLVGALGVVVVTLGVKGLTNAADEPVPPRAEAPVVPAPAALPDTVPAPAAAAPTPDVAPAEPPVLDAPTSLPSLPQRHFGAATVPGAHRFELPMTMPIAALVGSTTERGIEIEIQRSNSSADPSSIVSQHPAVQRARISNRGENAKLELEWRPGFHPAYRIEAVGNRLVILLGR